MRVDGLERAALSRRIAGVRARAVLELASAWHSHVRRGAGLAALAAAILGGSAGSAEPNFRSVGVCRLEIRRPGPTGEARRLEVTIWYPSDAPRRALESRPTLEATPATGGPFPLVVYSHGGCGGDPGAVEPLALFLAARGFTFLQFPHPGSSRGDCASDGEKWVRGLLERPGDIAYVIDRLPELDRDPNWILRGAIDSSRVGLLGHSQGGHVAFLLPPEDERFKAAIAVSPSLDHPDTPAAVWESIARSRCPTLIIYGARDASWTEEGSRRAYERLPPAIPHGFLLLAEMAHTPSTRSDLDLLERYSLAWFSRYLRGDEAPSPLLTPSGAPSGARFESTAVR